ncbi:hypothetical protein, partial [Streptomyces sp. SID8380]|uniref:hypothetical protein n=1 Tax=Streptomyces sp. SID8380 TaxID=2690360 RepID=UPI001F42B4D5
MPDDAHDARGALRCAVTDSGLPAAASGRNGTARPGVSSTTGVLVPCHRRPSGTATARPAPPP